MLFKDTPNSISAYLKLRSKTGGQVGKPTPFRSASEVHPSGDLFHIHGFFQPYANSSLDNSSGFSFPLNPRQTIPSDTSLLASVICQRGPTT